MRWSRRLGDARHDLVDVGELCAVVLSLLIPADATVREFPFHVTSVTACRTDVTEDLLAHNVERSAIEDANLVIGELVMNAVRHGQPRSGDSISVAWALVDGSLRFSVSDGGHVHALHANIPSPTAIGGRGLGIVAVLTTAWTFDNTDGTTVTADIPAPRNTTNTANAASAVD